MAEFQIAVRYQPPAQRTAFLAMCVLLPVWCIAIPMGFGVCMTFFFINLMQPVAPVAFVGALLFLMAYLAGYLASATSEDDSLHVQKEGIAVPLYMLPKLGFKRLQSWQNLKSARLLQGEKSRVLSLEFADQKFVNLNLNHIEKSKLESFLLAIELWGKDCERSSDVLALQGEVQAQAASNKDGFSYTHVWQDELSRRFATTSFVPLEPNMVLHDGRISVVRQLAFGGFSAVYLAQRNGREQVVLKEAVVPDSADPAEKEVAEKHLKRESQMLFAISHSGIAKVLDFFVEDGRYYLVMEYVNGQDLRQLVRQHGAQPEAKVVDWAYQVANVLEYLHNLETPIIHRDISPDNIVLDNNGYTRVIDFGASNQFVGTATGTLIGKQAYMAPEQIRGKANPASDVYALGATMYFLLTGKEPKPLTPAAPKNINEAVSDDLNELILRCTAYDIEERVADATSLKNALKLLRGETSGELVGAGS